MSGFKRATKTQARARVALDGPSGSGKTWTALVTATALAEGLGRVALIDSERGSASKYADRWDFDVMEIDGDFHPRRYIEGIGQAAEAGYAVVVIDSLTHAWDGRGGVKDIVEAAKPQFGGNYWAAWSVGTPQWRALIDAMLQAPLHVIATLRTKTEWAEQEERGKKTYERVGTAPVARDGIEYEFDVVGDLDLAHNLVISKTRAGDAVEKLYREPGPEFGRALRAWLEDGAIDTRARAKQLAQASGDTAALKAALSAASITQGDLADEGKFAEANRIAKEIAERPDPPAVDESAGDDFEKAADEALASVGKRREPDDDPPPKAKPAPDGQETLGGSV